MKRTTIAVVLLIVGLAAPAAAQYEDDEQTDDYREQDRRYYERYAEKKPQPEAEPEDDAARTAAFVARAEEMIRDRSYSAGDSEHYRVQTDDPRLRPDAAARLLESFRGFFDGFWQDGTEMRPYDETSRVFLFYSFYKFNELLEGDYRYRAFRPKGHYGSLYDVITLHTDAGDGGSLADALIHEAAHQLVAQRMFDGRLGQSVWLNEGLATYFGNTLADDEGIFHAGQIGGKPAPLFIRPVKDSGAERKGALRAVRDAFRAARSGESPLLEPLVSIHDPGDYYGENATLNYAASWLLVHFLLHGDEGRHADAFRRYIALERQDRGGPQAFYAELELSPAELESAVDDYVKKLKAR